MKNIFKPKKRISNELKELLKAKKLLKKFFSLHVIKVLLIFLIFLLIAPIIIFYFYRPRVQEEINYGVTFSHKYARDMGLDWQETYLQMLDDLQVKHLRLVAYWDEIEAVRDEYNFETIEWQLEEAEKRNLNVIMTIGRKVPRYPECFEPTWWKEMENDEYKNVELYEYIKIATNTLKKYESIKLWQVENEPFFKFGECHPEISEDVVRKEVQLVRSIDDRKILTQDSGEGGFWHKAYQMGDFLGISMYRKVWYDFWGVFFGNFIYFKYPLAHWTYKIKSELTLVPHEKILVTELQAEPWGPGINSKLTQEEKNKTMSRHDFLDTISYAQKAGFKDLYFWGVEWWYWEKVNNSNPFFWDSAKALFN